MNKYIHYDASLTEINSVHFAAALVIQTRMVPNYSPHNTRITNKIKEIVPLWKKTSLAEVNALRKEVSQIQEYLNNTRSQKLVWIINNMKAKYLITTTDQLRNTQAQIKMKITAKAKEIRNKDERFLTKKQNEDFNKNPKQFYRTINQDAIEINTPPPQEALSTFWRSIYENEVQHAEETTTIETIQKSNCNSPIMSNLNITLVNLS